MSTTLKELIAAADALLQAQYFPDYCPNGLTFTQSASTRLSAMGCRRWEGIARGNLTWIISLSTSTIRYSAGRLPVGTP